uniref:C2H2-type domain-containing protein n=1 Tax=Angiostrongylus cantonensis TaxID=6313 RepID=A0A0K0D9H2_ANGCA
MNSTANEDRIRSLLVRNDSTSATLIVQRLLYLVGKCDIDRATCCIPMCGRVFTTVEVLAWHMSYSHHDLSLKSAYGTLCFVCGIRMYTVKLGKNSNCTTEVFSVHQYFRVKWAIL